eukprot:SAG31_NODE_5425_length_2546_cov_2.299550_2_plen_88_part_00
MHRRQPDNVLEQIAQQLVLLLPKNAQTRVSGVEYWAHTMSSDYMAESDTAQSKLKLGYTSTRCVIYNPIRESSIFCFPSFIAWQAKH